MKINEKVLDQLLAECENPEQIIGENGLLKQLTKAVLERALEAEMSHHLGYEKHSPGRPQQRQLAQRIDAEKAARRLRSD